MSVMFDDEIFVHYGFITISALDTFPNLDDTRGGQVNGLCGAAVPGALSLVTGLHTGNVPVRVECLTGEPDLGSEWQDIVEVSFTIDEPDLVLGAFDFTFALTLPQAGTYRVRYCASGMDAAHDGTRMDDEPALDRYLLQLWPAPYAPDAVIRQGSAVAEYWHGVARRSPPPPPPPTDAELAAAARAEAELKAEREEASRERIRALMDRRQWGDREPSTRMRAVGGRTAQLARRDYDLVAALADLDSGAQRAIALWAARAACDIGELTDNIAINAALDALERGMPLPAPFDNHHDAWTYMFPGPKSVTVAEASAGETIRPRISSKAAAVDALLAAADPDPAQAVMGAVDAASNPQSEPSAFFAEIRRLLESLPDSTER